MIALNIGSGNRRFDSAQGWVNVDCVSREPDAIPDLICDVGREPLPFADDSVDLIVAWHVVEHAGCGEADSMLKECHRVMKTGASFVCAVPDLRKLAQRWISRGIEDFIFMINTFGPYDGTEGSRHRWGYSQESLEEYLAKVNPWKVKRFDWRQLSGTGTLENPWWFASAEAVKQ